MSTLASGQRVGRYRIVRFLGAGAMGEVYLAEDPHIERRLAIKTVRLAGGRPQDVEDRKKRLLREARAAGRLLHPNVVALFDAGEEDGLLFLAFEYVEGADLASRLETGPPPTLREVLRIVRQVAEALDCAHRQGIVHRDIKPSNILIDAAGHVKVADFGIAKVAGQNTELTVAGSVMGSPQYLSPEQIRGDELDGRSDIFSLGVVLYELLSGRRPFDGETITTLVYQILHKEPSIAELRTVPLRLEQLLHNMLAKDRDQRLATAALVAEELAAIERELPEAVLAAPAAPAEDVLDVTRVLPSRSVPGMPGATGVGGPGGAGAGPAAAAVPGGSGGLTAAAAAGGALLAGTGWSGGTAAAGAGAAGVPGNSGTGSSGIGEAARAAGSASPDAVPGAMRGSHGTGGAAPAAGVISPAGPLSGPAPPHTTSAAPRAPAPPGAAAPGGPPLPFPAPLPGTPAAGSMAGPPAVMAAASAPQRSGGRPWLVLAAVLIVLCALLGVSAFWAWQRYLQPMLSARLHGDAAGSAAPSPADGASGAPVPAATAGQAGAGSSSGSSAGAGVPGGPANGRSEQGGGGAAGGGSQPASGPSSSDLSAAQPGSAAGGGAAGAGNAGGAGSLRQGASRATTDSAGQSAASRAAGGPSSRPGLGRSGPGAAGSGSGSGAAGSGSGDRGTPAGSGNSAGRTANARTTAATAGSAGIPTRPPRQAGGGAPSGGRGAADTAAGLPPTPSTGSPANPPTPPTPSAAAGADAADNAGAAATAAVAADRVLHSGMELAFRINPPDAIVLLDGGVIGRAADWSGQKGARSFMLPDTGAHLIKIKKPGMKDYRISVEARATRGVTWVDATLQPLPAAQVETADLQTVRVRESVAFHLHPEVSATVIVDGTPAGPAQRFAGRFGHAEEWLPLAEGSHRVTVSAPGYRRQDVAVEVFPGADRARQRIDINLTPQAGGGAGKEAGNR